jgi:hypothetical protein
MRQWKLGLVGHNVDESEGCGHLWVTAHGELANLKGSGSLGKVK